MDCIFFLICSSDDSDVSARLSSFNFRSLSFIKFVICLVNSTVLICSVPLSEKNESLILYICNFCKVFTVTKKVEEKVLLDLQNVMSTVLTLTLLIDLFQIGLDFLLNIDIHRG